MIKKVAKMPGNICGGILLSKAADWQASNFSKKMIWDVLSDCSDFSKWVKLPDVYSVSLLTLKMISLSQ